MIYLVERYVPGLSSADLERALERLREATHHMRSEGTPVRYLGSMIVPDDEACFCQFESPSVAPVAEANRRAGLAFDRIVRALSVSPASRAEHENDEVGRDPSIAGPDQRNQHRIGGERWQ